VSPITVSVCYSPGVPEVLKEAAGNRSARSCLRGQHVPVSADVTAVLWQQCGRLAAQAFVEG